MKSYLFKVLVAACSVLAIALFLIKRSDNAQHDTDVTTITDFSNHLDSAYAVITTNQATILALSNTLAETSLALSNRLTEAQSALAVQADKITSLNGQVAATTSENQALGRSVVDLTNQVAVLTGQLTLIQTNLAENRKILADVSSQNSLLQHAFLRDVAERVVVERKFNNPDQLRAQLQMLKTNPPAVISAERIYASLNVEVNSNGVAHVISPE